MFSEKIKSTDVNKDKVSELWCLLAFMMAGWSETK